MYIMLLLINKSCIYIDIDIMCLNDYINYIIELLKIIIIEDNLEINIIIGNDNFTFNNNNNVIKININYEHTLVKKGGRSVMQNCVEGNVFTNNGEPYLVRIERYDELSNGDIIIDYSIPNICNVFLSKQYDNFFKKMLYISPVLYVYDLQKYNFNKRKISLLTTFINTNEPRRRALLDKIKSYNLEHKNVNDCFDKTKLEELYLNTKIIINIHQTNDHHTFEELRCLPALLSGVIVISEISPLNNLIPYNDLIIWTSYDDVIKTTIKVIDNYDYYYNKIFNSKILSELHKNNIQKLKHTLMFKS
jgi:hypothetical protein